MDNKMITGKYLDAKRSLSLPSHGGAYISREVVNYRIRFLYTENNIEKEGITTEQYTLEQVAYIKKNKQDLSITYEDNKIYINDINEIDDVTSKDKLDFLMDNNKYKDNRITGNIIAITLELLFLAIIICLAIFVPPLLSNVNFPSFIIYLVCLGLGAFWIKIAYESIWKFIIKLKGKNVIAHIDELYNDRSLYNQRVYNYNKPKNRNSSHDFVFVRYTYKDENGSELSFDQIVVPKIYSIITNLEDLPIIVYKNRSCINEDLLS